MSPSDFADLHLVYSAGSDDEVCDGFNRMLQTLCACSERLKRLNKSWQLLQT